MPRSARILLPYTSHYIRQHGHNNSEIFFEPNDYQQYLNNLNECKILYNIKIFAYCLLENQIHLVIKPDKEPKSISRFMKRVAGRQTRYTNARYMRSGSLWDGRFKSSPIDETVFLHSCCRYIEYLPFYLEIAKTPQSYQWSSLGYHHGLRQKDIVDDLPEISLPDNECTPQLRQHFQPLEGPFSKAEFYLAHDTIQHGVLSGSLLTGNKSSE